jgi:hypothetical protein
VLLLIWHCSGCSAVLLVVVLLLLLLLLLLLQATTRSDENDGIIDRPRLFARDPTLFNLFHNIFTPSVKRFDYRSVCLNCTSKWRPAATVPLNNTAPAVSCIQNVHGVIINYVEVAKLMDPMQELLHCQWLPAAANASAMLWQCS